MISFLRGTVAHVSLSTAVIDLNGAGMSVYATPQTLSHLHVGEEAKLFTSLIVREDSLTLLDSRTTTSGKSSMSCSV